MKHFLYIFFLLFFSLNYAQQTEYVDFKTVKADILISPKAKKVSGAVEYSFEILKNTDSVFIDARHMSFHKILLNNKKVSYKNTEKQLWIYANFEKSTSHSIYISYEATPKKAMYFIGWDSESQHQVWTQGQGKYTSHWLPSFDDMNEKVEFDLSVTFDKNYQVIANGKLINKNIGKKTTRWHYDMQQPMPSYLVALAIGSYNKKVEYSRSGIPLEMYYYPEDSTKFEPTYRYTKQIFNFLEHEIGVPFPWQNYKQIPVKDFLYAGMENTGTTIFSDAFVVDSVGFVDKNYVNVNAHELAHQWFGNLVTATHGTHHWLQEGFATYYALLAERDIFGNDYFYWKLYESAQQLIDQDRVKPNSTLLNPKASSLTFYQKGAWVLHLLREKIGDNTFKIAVKNYLLTYQFKNVETANFISEVEKASQQDLTEFVEKWLMNDTFHHDEAMKNLKQHSTFINEYLMVDCEVKNSKCEYYLTSGVSDRAKLKIIAQIPDEISSEIFNNSIKVRQQIAVSLHKIPKALKTNYESLLDDKSYITIETALFNLWNNFEKNRKKYLQQTKGIHGFSDKNIRTLWLALAIVTPDFEPENKHRYLNELTDYTTAEYGFGVRQNAFKYLTMINACEAVCQENLKDASKHHNWRFNKFAKTLLKDIQTKEQ